MPFQISDARATCEARVASLFGAIQMLATMLTLKVTRASPLTVALARLSASDRDVLILVRHGRTSANASGLLQGRLDLPLDGVGRAQVAAMAGYSAARESWAACTAAACGEALRAALTVNR